MRPHDLHIPRDSPKSILHDGVFVVPRAAEQFTALEWQHIFGNPKPVCLEYCSGNGAWIAERAANTGENWVALEMKFARVRKIWSKKKNHQLDNLLIICGEGKVTTEKCIPEASVDTIFINFPDPWPKRKHHKYRLIQTAFAIEMARILKSGGTVTFVSDDTDYREWTKKKMTLFVLEAEESLPETYGSSYFEEMWREQGKESRLLRFRKP